MSTMSELLKWVADKIDFLTEQLRSLLHIEVSHTSETRDVRKGTHKKTAFALRIGDRPKPPRFRKRLLSPAEPALSEKSSTPSAIPPLG